MIDFLNWWAETWWRVIFALVVLFGIFVIIYDSVIYITNVLKLKYEKKSEIL